MEPLVCQLVPVVMVFFGLHNNVRHMYLNARCGSSPIINEIKSARTNIGTFSRWHDVIRNNNKKKMCFCVSKIPLDPNQKSSNCGKLFACEKGLEGGGGGDG